MKFNQQLLEGVEQELWPIAKIVLFALNEGINVFETTSSVHLKDEYQGKVNLVMSRLINNGSIEEDYTVVVSRYRLARDLYVEEWHTIAGGADVNALRVHWSHKQLGIAGKAGDPDYVKKLVARLMAERGWTFSQIVEAGKKYIENCRNSGRIIRDLPNFLFDKDGSSMIAEFVEEGGEEESVNLQNDFL